MIERLVVGGHVSDLSTSALANKILSYLPYERSVTSEDNAKIQYAPPSDSVGSPVSVSSGSRPTFLARQAN